MKVKLEIDPDAVEDELIIKAKNISDSFSIVLN